VDLRSHTFFATHVHAAATNGGGDVLIGIAVVFGCSLALFAVMWLWSRRDDSGSDPGWDGGGSGPDGPSTPPSGPSWWPDFERDFARYAANRPSRRRRAPELVGEAPKEP
jgi:hypothetical protein